MSYSYEQRKRFGKPQTSPPEQASVPGPDLDALKAGAANPAAAQKGTPFDLDAAMKAKMERAFGDLALSHGDQHRNAGRGRADLVQFLFNEVSCLVYSLLSFRRDANFFHSAAYADDLFDREVSAIDYNCHSYLSLSV